MPDFVKLAATAKRLVEGSARTVTFFKANRLPADAAKPWRGPESGDPTALEGGATLEVLASFVPVGGSGLGRDEMDRPGTLIRDAQQFALVAATSLPDGTDLAEFDSIEDGSTVWKIVHVAELHPADTGLLWSVAVTR